MAPRLSRLIAVFAAATAVHPLPALAQAGTGPTFTRYVVTRQMIEEAGLLRLGEVVRLAPQWNAVTLDDFTWRTAPRTLAPGEEDRWTLLLDGRHVGAGILGVSSLERLPIDLASIDSIVFVSSPTLEGDVFAEAGLIHLHTGRPGSGVSARGRVGFGSETGDPGPFVFLPDGRQNRDRYGHESAVEAAIRHGRWYAAGSYTASVHLPTDPLILERIYASSSLTPRIERVAPAFRFGTEGAGGRHHLIAGTSRIDDWMRLDMAGIEEPVRSTLTHASAAGSIPVRMFDLGYRAGFENSHVATKPGAAAPPFDFEWRTMRTSVEVRARGRSERIGVTLGRRTGRRAAAQSLDRVSEIGVFGGVGMRSGAALRHHLAASISSGGHGAEGGVVLANVLDAGAGELSLRLMATRRRALTPLGLLHLAAQGDPWFDEAGAAVSLPSHDQTMRSAGAELGWQSGAVQRTEIWASASFRAFDGLTSRRALTWDPVFHAWRGPVQVVVSSGRLAAGHLAVRHRVSSRLVARADLHLARAFGESAVRRVAEPLPVVRSVLSATWRPVEGFGLRSEVEFESERRWPDYAVATAGPAKARAHQPAGATASISAWKLFANGRFRGQFAARNLTGRRVILHPEGRASALAFLFLLGAAL